ncbi:hypothetical protein FRC02_009060 [Tulasnella sp. 418]|nr:hypothetical protein FRC02_009060 [Tulasnella sp. 418]
MSSPISVAILGAGIFAREAHLPAVSILSSSQTVTLSAVYSRSHKSASALATLAQETLNLTSALTVYSEDAEAGLDALLSRSDIQAVIIALPINDQPNIILRSLKAGKHVLSEKPVGKDVKNGVDLINTYEKEYKPKGLVWRVAENFECEPGIVATAEAIRSGKIGDVAFFKLSAVNFMDKSSKWYQTSWRTVPDYQGGFVLDGGVHSAALLRTVLPSEITSVSGHASLVKDWLAPHDTIQSVLRLASGAHGTFELSWGAPSKARAENFISISGTKGHIEITGENIQLPGQPEGKTTMHWVVKIVGEDEKEDVQKYATKGIENEIKWFAEAIGGKDNGAGSPRGALRDVAVIQASLTSSGQLVDIKKLVGEA